jgi:magnesium-transporting ATPase (P-type)
LKHDSASTIALLSEAGIESRMITGDNIYIAIETSIRCGILARNQEIMVVEGKDQRFLSDIPMGNQVI